MSDTTAIPRICCNCQQEIKGACYVSGGTGYFDRIVYWHTYSCVNVVAPAVSERGLASPDEHEGTWEACDDCQSVATPPAPASEPTCRVCGRVSNWLTVDGECGRADCFAPPATAEPATFPGDFDRDREIIAGGVIRRAVEHDAEKMRFYLTISVGDLAQQVVRALAAPASSEGAPAESATRETPVLECDRCHMLRSVLTGLLGDLHNGCGGAFRLVNYPESPYPLPHLHDSLGVDGSCLWCAQDHTKPPTKLAPLARAEPADCQDCGVCEDCIQRTRDHSALAAEGFDAPHIHQFNYGVSGRRIEPHEVWRARASSEGAEPTRETELRVPRSVFCSRCPPLDEYARNGCSVCQYGYITELRTQLQAANRTHLRRHTRLSEAVGFDPGYSADATVNEAIKRISALAAATTRADSAERERDDLRKILAEATVECSNCGGSGYVFDADDDEDNCHICNTTGRVPAAATPASSPEL